MSKLTLAQANKIVEAALAKARELKTKPLAVAVLDDAGHVKALQREDDANMFRNRHRDRQGVGRRRHGRVEPHAAAARQGQSAVLRRARRRSRQGKFVPQTGAVLIKDKDGNVLGAAGGSGGTGDEDEAVCIAGIDRPAGLVFRAEALLELSGRQGIREGQMFEPAERLKSVKVSASAAMTRKVRELRAQGVKIVGLSSGEPDFVSPRHAIEAALQGSARRRHQVPAAGRHRRSRRPCSASSSATTISTTRSTRSWSPTAASRSCSAPPWRA